MRFRYYFSLVALPLFILLSACDTSFTDIANERDFEENNQTFRVLYDANSSTGGTVPVDSTVYDLGQTVNVIDNTGNLIGPEIRDGIKQRFLGWNRNPGSTSVEYAAGDTFSYTVDVTLYAIYTTGTDVLRKVGPAGGWIFYDAGSIQSWGRYLESANEDIGSFTWGINDLETGATATGFGAGKQNTLDIIANDGLTNKAADNCSSYTVNFNGSVYNDWFLPSRDELSEICWILHGRRDEEGVRIDNPDVTVPLGNFVNSLYWSSSEWTDSSAAYNHYFLIGHQEYSGKNAYCLARPVRSF